MFALSTQMGAFHLHSATLYCVFFTVSESGRVGERCFYLLNDSGYTAINTFGRETNNTREEGTTLGGFYRVAVLEEYL
jgi:hypothetical protein